MPILHVYSPLSNPPAGLLDRVCEDVAASLAIPISHAWALWQAIPKDRVSGTMWSAGYGTSASPVVMVYCRDSYTHIALRSMMLRIRDRLAEELTCDGRSVFIALQRVHPQELYARGDIWQGDPQVEQTDSILIRPIGMVHNSRLDAADDHWSGVESRIELDTTEFSAEALSGLSEFSHVEVLFFLHRVPPSKIERGARHPRNNPEWPRVGVFAQRAKNRPNRLAVSRCRLLDVTGTTVTVEGLDAIDGTPVLDIKPYFAEFGPRGRIAQPEWSNEIMREYY